MFKILFAKQKKLPWKPKKDRGAKPCLSRFPRELRVRCFARDARPIRPSARLLFPIATPHQGRDGCWAIHLYSFYYTTLTLTSQHLLFRYPCSEPISARLWAEINSKKFARAPWKVGGGRRRTPRIAGSVPVLFQFVPKKLEQDFSLFTCGFARFAKSCSNSVFRIGTGFLPVYQALCSFVPIVPVFNKFLYIDTYKDSFLYSFLLRVS